MVLGLAEQSGGRLQLESRPGQGTSARLWLPAEEAQPAAPVAPTIRSDALPKTEPLDVLVVDDDALVLLNTAAMLEDMGHAVITASSGTEALRLLGEGPSVVDLVITDQGMPGMTGLQLIDRVRGLRPHLPVVLATGYSEVPADSAQDYVRLPKPFFQRQLAEAVEAAIGPGKPTHGSI
jgi:CheY-like chemotaxis protein